MFSTSLFSRLSRKSTSRNRNRRKRTANDRTLRRICTLEKLEDRQLLSANPLSPMAGVSVVRQFPGDPLFTFEQRINPAVPIAQELRFGMPNDPGLRPGSKVTPIAGDWNRSGYDSPGVVIPHHNGGLQFKLDNDGEPLEEYRFFFGFWDDQFAIGDINGDGYDDIVVVRPGDKDELTGKKFLDWYITYGPFPTLGSPETDTFLPTHDILKGASGLEGDRIVLGDWNGDGRADFGAISKDPIYEEGVWVYQWWLPMASGMQRIPFGTPGTRPIVGNWDGIGGDNIGVVWEGISDKPLWQLDTNWDLHAEIESMFTPSGAEYLVGRWQDFYWPTASLASVSNPQLGDTHTLVQIQLKDNVAVDGSMIDGRDIRVTGPHGNSLPVALHSKQSNANGSEWNVMYRVTAPGGTWDPTDNGVWSITMVAYELKDTSGNPVAGTKVGELNVNLTAPSPTATLIAPTLPNPGDTHMSIQVRYESVASGATIDVSSIDAADIRVTGPTGNALPITLQGINANTNGTPRIATYRITAPGGTWGAEDNGVYTIYAQWNEVRDTYGKHVDGRWLGEFTVSLVPPSPAPSATVRPGSVTTPGATQHWVEVTFTGYPALECSTVSQDDIYVIRTSNGQEIRPSNYVRQGVCLSPSTAREVTASYAIQGPGGTWDSSDNGWYDVYVRAGEVLDTSGRAVPADRIGSFEVTIAQPDTDPPTATLISLPVPKPNDPHVDFQVRYEDNVAVRVASFASSNIRVTGPTGQVLTVSYVSSDVWTDGTPRIVTYRVQAPGGTWDPSDNGAYTISLVGNQVRDTAGNAALTKPLGSFPVNLGDVVVPKAKLLSVSTIVAGGTQTEIRMEYTDNVAVNVATITPANLRVTSQSGQALTVTSVATDQPTNGSSRIATYRVQAPGGTWDSSDNGLYTIFVVEGQVQDTSRNSVLAGKYGDFRVDLAAADRRPRAELMVLDVTSRNATKHTLKVTYTGDQMINVSTLDSRDIRVTGPNRYNVLAKLKSVDQKSNGPLRIATYEISAPRGGWKVKSNGQYIVSMVSNQVRDVTGNSVPGGELGRFNVQVSEFDIQLIFSDNNFTSSQRAVIRQAADRWQQVILGNLPSVRVRGLGTVDDVAIYVSASQIDGGENILAQAGPTALRSRGSLPYLGRMDFQRADLPGMEASGKLFDLALHEMAHVLGFGTIWKNKGLLVGEGTTNPRFTGAQATNEYRSIFNVNATGVPVENTGPVGTRDSHWRISVFGNELMVGALSYNATMPLSRITVASFADLGYMVNMNAADPYAKPASSSASMQIPQVNGSAIGGIWALAGEHFGAHLATAIQTDEALEPALAPEQFAGQVAAMFPVNPPVASQPEYARSEAKATFSAQGDQTVAASEDSIWSILGEDTAHLNNNRPTPPTIARLSSNRWHQAVDELFQGGRWFAEDAGTYLPEAACC